jgi:hypothetical protein
MVARAYPKQNIAQELLAALGFVILVDHQGFEGSTLECPGLVLP